jgi:hypothetical protein
MTPMSVMTIGVLIILAGLGMLIGWLIYLALA